MASQFTSGEGETEKMISTKKYIYSCLRSAPRQYPAAVPGRAESPGGCTSGRVVAAYFGALVSPPPQRNEPDKTKFAGKPVFTRYWGQIFSRIYHW